MPSKTLSLIDEGLSARLARRGLHAIAPWLALVVLAAVTLPGVASAQAPVRRSFAKPIAFERPTGALTDYNLKLGPVLFKFSTSLRTEYLSNVNLSSGAGGANGGSDLLVGPEIGITASWQATKLNALSLNVSLGYLTYLKNPQYNSPTINIAPGSQLTFDVYTGDFRIRFFDSFSIVNNPATSGQLSNVGNYTQLNNTMGISVLWDLDQLLLGLGYQHYNLVALSAVSGSGQGAGTASSSTLNTLNRYSDTVQFTAVSPILSTTTVGLDVAADLTRYPDNPANDSSAARIAPFVQTQLTAYTSIRASVGYQLFTFLNGGTATQVVLGPGAISTTTANNSQSSEGSLYFNLGVIHRLNRYYIDSLNMGQQTQNDILSAKSTTTYANYSSSWQLSPLISLSTSLSFQDVTQASGQGGDYQYFTGSLSTAYVLTKHLSTSLAYIYTQRFGNALNPGYVQNDLTLVLKYDF